MKKAGMRRNLRMAVLMIVSTLFWTGQVSAQSTEFAFQGRLTDAGVPVAVNYDLRFTLFAQSNGGAAIGTVERIDVPVSNGVFTVKLDFGSAAFDGTARWIETEVKPTGGGAYQPLNPRVFLTTVPYSVRSLTAANATQLGGVAATEFVQTTDPRMTDARPPAPGDGSYIQNTTAAQAASNFNIMGIGKANILDAATQFNLGGTRVLSTQQDNFFLGWFSGASNQGGSQNTYVGIDAGGLRVVARDNTFVGYRAGASGTQGNSNSFFGSYAGVTTRGHFNSFFGAEAGFINTTGDFNSFFGYFSGNSNSGSENAYFGSLTRGSSGSIGNTLLGHSASNGANLTNATAIGYRAAVTQNNSLVLGSINGVNTATSDTKVGIGTTAPSERFEVRDNAAGMIVGGAGCATGAIAIGLNGAFGGCANYSFLGDGLTLFLNRPTGGQIVFRENNGPTQLRLRSGGVLQLETLGTAGATPLCHNAAKDISTCSSSIRYKTNVNDFSSSLDLIRKLRPVSFNWTVGGMPDIGLVAEEVSAVEPLLTTTNEKGEVEGVKYDRVGVVLVNAVNEQQQQIGGLKETVFTLEGMVQLQQNTITELNIRLKQQLDEMASLKALVCAGNPGAEFCRKQ